MRTLLVAVDSSDYAQRAVDYAIAQAANCPIKIHLINVQLLPDNYGTVQAYLSRDENRRFTKKFSRDALNPAERKLRRAGVPHSVHTVWGDIAPEIVRASRRFKCESIIMGTRGMGAIGNLLLGSTATKVIHLSKVPVTLVK
jgi:nucleotide-binding universal stress UspA family protein